MSAAIKYEVEVDVRLRYIKANKFGHQGYVRVNEALGITCKSTKALTSGCDLPLVSELALSTSHANRHNTRH